VKKKKGHCTELKEKPTICLEGEKKKGKKTNALGGKKTLTPFFGGRRGEDARSSVLKNERRPHWREKKGRLREN